MAKHDFRLGDIVMVSDDGERWLGPAKFLTKSVDTKWVLVMRDGDDPKWFAYCRPCKPHELPSSPNPDAAEHSALRAAATTIAPVADRLKAIIDLRTAKGIATYGEALQVDNGRDPMTDALAEAIDLNQYLVQRVMQLEAELRACRATTDAQPYVAEGRVVETGGEG